MNENCCAEHVFCCVYVISDVQWGYASYSVSVAMTNTAVQLKVTNYLVLYIYLKNIKMSIG